MEVIQLHFVSFCENLSKLHDGHEIVLSYSQNILKVLSFPAPSYTNHFCICRTKEPLCLFGLLVTCRKNEDWVCPSLQVKGKWVSSKDKCCLRFPFTGWCCKVVLLDCSCGWIQRKPGHWWISVKAFYKKQFNGLILISMNILEKSLLVAFHSNRMSFLQRRDMCDPQDRWKSLRSRGENLLRCTTTFSQLFTQRYASCSSQRFS